MDEEKDALPSGWIKAIREGLRAGLHLAHRVRRLRDGRRRGLLRPELDPSALAYVLRTAQHDAIEHPRRDPGLPLGQ